MDALARIRDHWTETVADYILEQYKESPNWKAILKSVIDKFTGIEDNIWKLAPILDFKCRVKKERPTGALLDFVAGIVNLEREAGESDETFYARFINRIEDDTAGTPDNIIVTASDISGDPRPMYIDEAPATFFVYTPNGNQMKRADVKKLAPCGVLGLPGAAIKLGNGNLLGCANGKLLLTVARDYRKNLKLLLVTDAGKVLSTDAGKMLYAEISD